MMIELTKDEMLEAGLLGLRRTIISQAKGLNHAKHGLHPDQWQIDILGAMAEKAVAKALGIYYVPTINAFKAPDVGQFYVRSTSYATGKLIIRQGDPLGVYVLVITTPPKFEIVGWLAFSGKDGSEYLSQPDPTRPPCWAFPQETLKSMETLRGVGEAVAG